MLRLGILLGVFLVVSAITRTPWFKGMIGEWYVNLGIKLWLDKAVYHLVKNVTLPAGEGTTQIDHIIVSRFGIFVIETKNMRGAIYGGEKEGQWTQAIGGKKFSFQNPLRQNYKHTMTLAETLGVPHEQLKPIIMFIGDAKLKTREKMPPNVMDHGLATFIKSHREQLLTEEEVLRVLATIEERRLAPGLTTHLNHVRHVKGIVAEKEKAKANRPASAPKPVQAPAAPIAAPVSVAVQESPSCPKCGKTMTLRTAKKGGGEFWGCSGFPACRSIVPVKA